MVIAPRTYVFVIALVIVACVSSRALARQDRCPDDDTTSELAARLREMRTIRGHFDGGAWNDDVDAWMGRKHTVMIELASRLSGGRCVKAQLAEMLGPADRATTPGEPLFEQLVVSNEVERIADELLVYHWRGTHDFLFFTCDGDRIIGSHWWHAGEE